MTRKRTKSQDENITTEDLGNGYTRVRVEGPNSVQRARDFIDTNFDNPAYYQGNLKDLEVEAYAPNSPAALFNDQLLRQSKMPTASDLQISYKVPHYSPDKVNDTVSDAERERYLHNLEKSGFDFDYANKVLKADRHASQYNPENFLKATGIGFLDPITVLRAGYDTSTGKVDENGNPVNFFQSVIEGNSGLVTDNFMRNHPIWGTTVNMIGGGATIGLGNKVFNLTRPLVQQGYGVFQNGINSIQGRFSPGGWFTLGNKQYRPSMSTLSSGFPVIESRPAWQLQELPGFQIKSLFKGSPLEKQLSKNGTLSLKQLQAYVNRNDVSTIDKELLGRVLQNHANDRVIDYNTLRQEVQGMIPQYNKIPSDKYADYGMRGLGFYTKIDNDAQGIRFNELTGEFEQYKDIPDFTQGYQLNTFTFESPGIGGNAKHYNRNTLGHSRTYTTTDEPDVLHVMESQSDWAQSGGFSINQKSTEKAIESIKDDLKFGNYEPYTKRELEQKLARLTKVLQYYKDYNSDPIKQRMIDTYLNRQLQENLRYAAQRGQTKMRYPTPETAAKIEGYQPFSSAQEIQSRMEGLAEAFQWGRVTQDQYQRELTLLQDALNNASTELLYPSDQQTILKKYADFPKQFQKLFGKQTPVRTVTDAKGNTWYEVDVPQNYLNGTAEMLFKKGGKLNPVERFKKQRRR